MGQLRQWVQPVRPHHRRLSQPNHMIPSVPVEVESCVRVRPVVHRGAPIPRALVHPMMMLVVRRRVVNGAQVQMVDMGGVQQMAQLVRSMTKLAVRQRVATGVQVRQVVVVGGARPAGQPALRMTRRLVKPKTANGVHHHTVAVAGVLPHLAVVR